MTDQTVPPARLHRVTLCLSHRDADLLGLVPSALVSFEESDSDGLLVADVEEETALCIAWTAIDALATEPHDEVDSARIESASSRLRSAVDRARRARGASC